MSNVSPLRAHIPASIEVSPKQAVESAAIEGLFPERTRVYITDVGMDSTETFIAGAKRLADLGYTAVPHFASRRMISKEILDERVKRLANEAGVTDVLVIGGGLDKPAGEFTSSMDMLSTGIFERHGIMQMGVAGHPEGSPDFSDDIAMEALHEKQAFADRTGMELRIVTQFGFDAPRFIDWADELRASGIKMPVHLGVAGPAKITTLIKFAAMCGVGNSLSFLKKRGSAIATMAKGFNPDEIVAPIEARWADDENQSLITQVHVFPFGGVKKSSTWLKERGSWGCDASFQCSDVA